MLKNKHVLIILLLFFFIFIPVSSAGDNNTDLIGMDNGDAISDSPVLNEKVDDSNEDLTDDGLNNESFKTLSDQIGSHDNYLELTTNYVYNSDIDGEFANGIVISKDNFIIDGKNHILNGNGEARIFDITGNNITISNIIFINGNISGDLGGAIHSSGSIILNNVTFKNNNASSGGAISVSGPCIINNAIFANNTASEDAGAIIAWNTLIIKNATITNNVATTSGGAIYVIGETTINDTLFADNRATFGGAIYSWTTTTIDNTTLKNNQGEFGGAIYAAGKTTISNVIMANNKATENGGAINAGDKTSLNNTRFINNTATKNGGAIFTNGNSDQINCTFENNSANNGGAIYFNKEIKNNLINSIFNGNNATRSGGAIFVRGPASNNTFTSQFNNNIAKEASGGGIFFYKTAEKNNIESFFTNNTAAYGAGMFFYDESNNNTFKGDFINNIAISCGGAMFFYSKTNYNRFNGSFIHNEAYGKIVEINGNGGAITFKNTSKNSIFECDFINNTARLYGGAVNYRMTPYNITFKGNFIANSAESGGGLNFFDEFENLSFSCNFTDNNAVFGGAIAVNKESNKTYSDRMPTIANCNFTDNNATKGGSIYFERIGMVKDCNFIHNHAEDGGAISASDLYGENLNFKNNTATRGGAIDSFGVTLKNNTFSANSAQFGASIQFLDDIIIEDSKFLNSHDCTYSVIYGEGKGSVFINNCEFFNLTSKYAPAMDIVDKNNVTVKNSSFKDLHALLSSGAIAMKTITDFIDIENCVFINTTAVNNGGALYLDVDQELEISDVNTTVKNNTFINCSANFGGAIVQLGGNIEIIDSRFLENEAEFDGAAIYVSFVNLKLNNTQIISNRLLDEDMFDGGGICCDKSNVIIINSLFEENTKNAIYSYGSKLSVENTRFNENIEAIHGVFTESTLIDNDYGNDTLFLNDTYYPTVIEENGMKIQLINNTINVEILPSRYDSRDWGWVSSVKDQGEMGSCWTFGNCGALESALLKATGIEYDFSENNMQNSMLKYSKYGVTNATEGGMYSQGLEYVISWLGIFPTEYDAYDEIGKISPLISTDENIHIQDAIFIGPRKNATDNDALKRAIIECGSVTLNYMGFLTAPYYNTETHALYQNETNYPNHSVSVVGWDDNYPASNFLITPPGDGAFIIKNSYGESFGDNGFIYISYYDTSILNESTWGSLFESTSVGYILKNQEPYTKIYQRDVGGQLNKFNNYTTFKVKYQSVGNDLISGVGSYFRENEEYTIEIYINDKLKYTQTGNAPFTGYHTVRLTSEIPIKDGDEFMVVMKKDFVPIIDNSTQFYESNSVFVEMNGEWVDMALENKSATLKVYTKDLPISTEDLVKIYKNDSQFVAEIGVANETVSFEINGVTYNKVTDENGNAKMNINLRPGNYTIKTTYNGLSVENNIEVLPTLIAENLVKYFRNASQFYVSLIDGEGKPVVGKNITMNINGVFYTKTTNENGTAKLNINLNPGEYILTATDPLTGLMMSYNITVLPTLNATDLEMTYKDGSTFNVTVLDGQGKPLVNAKVSFNINGVFYNKISDSNGIARLNINLMPGEYIITSEYENLRISNKITIAAKDD